MLIDSWWRKYKELGEEERLLETLDEKVPVVRRQAALALAEHKTRKVAQKLIELLADEYYGVREGAFLTLKFFSGCDYGYKPEKSPKENKDPINLFHLWVAQYFK